MSARTVRSEQLSPAAASLSSNNPSLSFAQPQQRLPIRDTTVKCRSLKRKPGPKSTGKGGPIMVRLQPPQLKGLDSWIADQPTPRPSRPEAIRRLINGRLSDAGKSGGIG